MAGPRVSRCYVLYCVAFVAAATASRADGIVYEKIPLGAIFEQGSDEVQTAFKLAVFKHNQNNTERRFELQAYVDVIKTADAFKLSKLNRPANGINAVKKSKNRPETKNYDEKSKKRVWNMPWSKKQKSSTSGSSGGGGGSSSSSSSRSSARLTTVTLSQTNGRPPSESGRAAEAMVALSESGEYPVVDRGNGGRVTTVASGPVTVTRVGQRTVNRSQTVPSKKFTRQTPPRANHSARTPVSKAAHGRPPSESDRAAMDTAALAESGEIPTGNRGNGGHAAVTTGLVTVTQVEQQTVNRSMTLPCKTFTQQTLPHIDHSARVPVPKVPTRWSCLPSHKTQAPRWMTTDHHIPITLPTCRPFTNMYNPVTRWFLKMTTVMNRWSRKSKVTKSRSSR